MSAPNPDRQSPRNPKKQAEVRELTANEEVPDAQLVLRAQQGDRWAEEAIYRRHVRFVAAVAVGLLRSRVDAEDVVQDTFALALGELASLRDGGALRAWLGRIAVSQVRRRFRRRRMLKFFGLDRSVEDAPLDAFARDATGEQRAEIAALDRVLDQLPTEQRIAWVLRNVEGEGLEDVARACDCSLATAKRRIAAADARVRLHVRLSEDAT